MSDMKVTREQRRRLLAQDYSPLDYDEDPRLEPGARYVLAWTVGTPEWEPGHGIRALRLPLWFITVTAVQRHRKGFWRVRFDVTDRRDPDLFLKRGGGYQAKKDVLRAGAVPDREWLAVRAKTVSEFWHQERLKRHAENQRNRGRDRRDADAA